MIVWREFTDNFCESAAPPVDTTIDIKVASEHSTSRESKWLKVLNWPSCLRSRFAHIVKVSKLDFRKRHVIAAALSLIGNFWRWKSSLWFMYVRIWLPRRNDGTRCTMKTSQHIVVQKCVGSQEIHLNRKHRKKSLWTLLLFTWVLGWRNGVSKDRL